MSINKYRYEYGVYNRNIDMNTNPGILNMDMNIKRTQRKAALKRFLIQHDSIYVLVSKSGPSSNPRALQTLDRFPKKCAASLMERDRQGARKPTVVLSLVAVRNDASSAVYDADSTKLVKSQPGRPRG